MSFPFLLQPHQSFLTSRSYFLFFSFTWVVTSLLAYLRPAEHSVWELFSKSAGRSQSWGCTDRGLSCDTLQGDLKVGSFMLALASQEQKERMWGPVWLCRHARCSWLPARLLSFVGSKGESQYWMGVHSRALTQAKRHVWVGVLLLWQSGSGPDTRVPSIRNGISEQTAQLGVNMLPIWTPHLWVWDSTRPMAKGFLVQQTAEVLHCTETVWGLYTGMLCRECPLETIKI